MNQSVPSGRSRWKTTSPRAESRFESRLSRTSSARRVMVSPAASSRMTMDTRPVKRTVASVSPVADRYSVLSADSTVTVRPEPAAGIGGSTP